MTHPTEGDAPDARPEDSTQSIPSEATQAIPATAPMSSQYAYPAQDPAAGVPLSDDPSADSAAPGAQGGRRKGLLIGGIAAVVVLAGAGAFAATKLSGAGARPADVLPSDTYAYVQVDIDPSAGQKIAAVRFLEKLPQVKDFQSGDARKKLWELAVKESDDSCLKAFDYDKDINPWLGDRVGFGLRPGSSTEPKVVVALQVKDEKTATTTLGKLATCGEGGSDVEVRTKDGYALLTKKGEGDATLAAVAKGTLAQNATFKDDLAALGEPGVLTAWADLPTMLKEVSNVAGRLVTGGAAADVPQGAKGRFVAALRFDPSFIELAGLARGVEGAGGLKPVAGDGAELGNLPDDTVAALHVSGAAQLVDSVWPQLKKTIEEGASAEGQDDPIGMIEDEFGLKLPDDLKTLLGRSFTLAVPQQDFAGEDTPKLGAKVVSDDAKRADEVVGILEEAAGGAGLLTRQVDGDKLYVATTPDYASALKAGGKLGSTEGFKAALGDTQKSNVALFVDLDKIEKLYLDQLDGDARAAVEAMRAVGLSSSVTGDGEGAFSFRIVAN